MKTKIALLFAVLMTLSACGSSGGMMHSEKSVDNVKVASLGY